MSFDSHNTCVCLGSLVRSVRAIFLECAAQRSYFQVGREWHNFERYRDRLAVGIDFGWKRDVVNHLFAPSIMDLEGLGKLELGRHQTSYNSDRSLLDYVVHKRWTFDNGF